MQAKLRRVSRVMRLVALAIILVVLGIVLYNVYDFWRDQVGDTPAKAIESYFNALAMGNYEEVYRLTAKSRLTDIYGRPITKDEFMVQLTRVTGGKQVGFRSIQVSQLDSQRGAQFYIVTLQSNLAGASGSAQLVVEVVREGKSWLIVYPFAIVL